MKMWVSDSRWGDILAMIEKLWSSSRGKRRHETILEVDKEEDEAPENKNNGDINVVHYKKGRSSHSSSLCFPHRMY